MVDGRLGFWVLLGMLALGGCGKSDDADDAAGAGNGGSAGHAAGKSSAGGAGSAGKASTGSGGSAGTGAATSAGTGGSGTGGSSIGGSAGKDAAGGSGAASGSGGRAGSAAVGGRGGDATGGGNAGTGEGGEPPEGAVDPVPAPGSSWALPTADPLNSTPPVLAAFGDAVVIAGGTTDPQLAGVSTFDGIDSEAFVAALDRQGKPIWSTPLPGAGLPQAIAVDPNGDIVVVAPYLPDATFVSTGFYGPETLIAKLSPAGTLKYAKDVTFESGDLSLAVDADGSIYLAGGEILPDGIDTANITVARFDADANSTWFKRFAHTGSTAYADGVALAKNGDVVITGQFNGSVSFGGDTLETQALLDTSRMQNGFIARFSKDGTHVRSERFGGTIFDLGTVLLPLASGDLLLAGTLSGSATIGGKTVSASDMGSAFLARIGDDDQASWVELAGDGYVWSVAADPDEGMFHVAGNLGDERWLAEFRGDGSQVLVARRPMNDLFFTTSMAVDSGLGLWLSGGFMGTADFGGGTVLMSDDAGVFLVRLARTGM